MAAPMFVDSEGNVLAMEGIAVKEPWVVLESSKFVGMAPSFDVNHSADI